MPPTPPPSKRPRLVRRALGNWLERHQHPFSFWIHLIGIPLSVAGFVAMFAFEPWYWGFAGLVFGYVLQYMGHLVEGNDMGEWVAVKRMLGLPYVAVSPRYQQAPQRPPG